MIGLRAIYWFKIKNSPTHYRTVNMKIGWWVVLGVVDHCAFFAVARWQEKENGLPILERTNEKSHSPKVES